MMNRRIVLTSLLGCSLPLAAQISTSRSDQAALQSLVDKVAASVNAKDAKALGTCFAEDAEFTNPVGTSIKGRAAIQGFHERLYSPTRFPNTPSFYHVQLKLFDTRVKMVRPDVASVDIGWQEQGAIGPDGAPWGTRKGLMSWVAVRDRDTWLVEVWHNMELPKAP